MPGNLVGITNYNNIFMRNFEYFQSVLEKIRHDYFPEINNLDQITLKIGQRARTRLGSIRSKSLKNRQSIVILNGLFVEEFIPEKIIEATIAHELCHYIHGFSSPLPQLFDHPHRGQTVDKEMIKRGLGDTLKFQKTWLKANWPEIVKANFKKQPRRRRRVVYFWR